MIMIKEKRTYKNIKTGELIYVEFVIGDYVVYSKDWKVYKMPTNEFTTQYTEFEYKCYVHYC